MQANHRVALPGFDDFLLADLLDPPASVIAQDPAAMGRVAAERLVARMDGDEQLPGISSCPPPSSPAAPARFGVLQASHLRTIIAPCRFRVRGSVSPSS